MKCVLCEFNKYDNCDYGRKKYITCISGLFFHSATIANVILIQIHKESILLFDHFTVRFDILSIKMMQYVNLLT